MSSKDNHKQWIDNNHGLPFYIWIEKATGYYQFIECKNYQVASKKYNKILPRENPTIHTTYTILNYKDFTERLGAKRLLDIMGRPGQY